MAINSKQKGARFERSLASILKNDYGYECRRKAQQENPHLKATAEVQGFRYDKETEFMRFAVKG